MTGGFGVSSRSLVRGHGAARDLAALTKPRITFTVVTTALVGYLAGGGPGGWPLIAALAGIALVAGGANAANMALESRTDALMNRTRHRPVPAGRVTRLEATAFSALATLTGLVLLARFSNSLAALVALLTWASYVFAYTPLKPVTSLATLVGGVPGALPPVIGWAAARGSLDPGAAVLFAILYVWQVPHFLAIAALYHEDYARAGLKVLPHDDPDGRMLPRQLVAYTVALWLVSLAPTLGGMAGWGYLGAAVVLGALFMALAVRFARRPSRAAASALFGGSIFYLLVLCLAFILDRR